jgi:hypothetical protein
VYFLDWLRKSFQYALHSIAFANVLKTAPNGSLACEAEAVMVAALEIVEG